MKVRYFIMLVLFTALIMIFEACNKSTEPESNTQTVTNAALDTSTVNSKDHEDANDYLWNTSNVIPIVLNGTSITASTSGAAVNGSILTITSSGTYSISGTLNNGQIIVNTEDKAIVRLILNGVNISCSASAPIYVKKAEKVILCLSDNTTNTLVDGSIYILENAAIDEPNAALYCKSNLTIFGNGTLKVSGNYNDAIASTDGLIIKSGNINVSSKDDGIRGKDYLIVRDGNVTVNAKGDGLKSDNSEDATKGYIQIENGTFDITSTGDAIAAETDVIIKKANISITSGGGSSKTVSSTESAKAIKGIVYVLIEGGSFNISSADDALHSNGYITLNNGTFIISSGDDGLHADKAIKINNGNIKITKSVEGIESGNITVNNGQLNITASDDGFNSTYGSGGENNDGSCLTLNGGNISVNTSRGDGLDSNGSIVMTGGTVVVHGPASNPEVGADYNGTFNISGGLLIFTGPNSGNMIEATSASSGQYTVKATASSQVAASTLFHVQDESGNDVITFQPVRNFYYIVFSSPVLKSGAAYYIYTGGTSTGTNSNGLYTGGTYSGGTQRKSFTISGKVTSVSF
ncbi:MAG: carbohydrate-binding domain-containing protein [Bacteroidota bacterium]|nr:carbohydrate-binding domain-containing protein [Bacteroidota bacterium]